MDEPGFFSNKRIVIIGLGLMGGSLALALKGKAGWLGGVDRSELAIQNAAKLNFFDNLSQNPQEILHLANVIILAAPVRQSIKILKQLETLTSQAAIVMDLGSTKRRITETMADLPARFDPIGCHPMCGSEKSSILYADSHLFEKARFIITPLKRTSSAALVFARNLASVIQSRECILDAPRHDQITADISHFPYLLSAALCLSTPLESKLLISTGFKSTARLAGSSNEMMLDIMSSNRDNVLNAMAAFKNELSAFEKVLQDENEEALKELMARAAFKYQQLIN
ncbi:MAG: prephenate dehydrogenase [Anaerolineae bacterium]|nr:prephenate dehydrogenase [Anaerolineae bacterium]